MLEYQTKVSNFWEGKFGKFAAALPKPYLENFEDKTFVVTKYPMYFAILIYGMLLLFLIQIPFLATNEIVYLSDNNTIGLSERALLSLVIFILGAAKFMLILAHKFLAKREHKVIISYLSRQ